MVYQNLMKILIPIYSKFECIQRQILFKKFLHSYSLVFFFNFLSNFQLWCSPFLNMINNKITLIFEILQGGTYVTSSLRFWGHLCLKILPSSYLDHSTVEYSWGYFLQSHSKITRVGLFETFFLVLINSAPYSLCTINETLPLNSFLGFLCFQKEEARSSNFRFRALGDSIFGKT